MNFPQHNCLATILTLLTVGSFLGCSPKDPTAATPEVAVVRIEARLAGPGSDSQGRGFLVSADGLIVTSLHVVDSAQDITVFRGNGDKLFADFVQGDKEADLAIIRVHARELPFLKMSADDVEPGMHARLLGTAGMVHGVFDHWENFGASMNVNAPMLPTDDGSPLLGDDGRVIAVARGAVKDNPSETLATPIFRVFRMMPTLEPKGWP